MTDGFDGAIGQGGTADLFRDGRPFLRCVHDAPPSVDFQMPL